VRRGVRRLEGSKAELGGGFGDSGGGSAGGGGGFGGFGRGEKKIEKREKGRVLGF
jgi:hypothetical protein